MNSIFSCDFIKPKSLSQSYANQLQKFATFSMSNKNLFNYCMQAGLDMQICLRPSILGEMCNVFPKRLIMDHYLDIAQLEKKFIETIDIDEGPTFKAILLVRDPRAVSNSRETLNLCDWNNNQTCIDVPKLCNRLDSNVDTGNKNLNYTLCLGLLGIPRCWCLRCTTCFWPLPASMRSEAKII